MGVHIGYRDRRDGSGNQGSSLYVVPLVSA